MNPKEPLIDSTPENESTGVADPPAPTTPLQALTAERDHLIEEKNDLLDRLLRRAERERADVLEFANTETVRSIVPILDDFERALKVECSGNKEYVRGMELIYQQIGRAHV